eukprot:13570871-Alexandrium_andersonii.AAC.1
MRLEQRQLQHCLRALFQAAAGWRQRSRPRRNRSTATQCRHAQCSTVAHSTTCLRIRMVAGPAFAWFAE